MEYVEGANLEQRLTRTDAQGRTVIGRPYPAEDVIRYGIQVCKVLEYLAGLPKPVVHQDIKPANLIVDQAGEVWLVDFGTAKARWAAGPGGKVGLQKSSVYGTVGYAPPEQYQGQSEPRSDVYALGATLYHLATDDDPRNHPFSFPRLSALPQGLRAALDAALQQHVNNRPTATQLRSQLEVLLVADPFHFRGGAVARNVAELAQACDRHWEDGKFHLYRGDFQERLRKWGRADLEAKAAAICQQVVNQDLGLDAFLRLLDSAYPQPQVQAAPPVQDLGRVPWGEQRTVQIEVRNAGKGCLQGRASAQAPWLAVTPADFIVHDRQTLQVTADTRCMTPRDGQAQAGRILLDAGPGGQATMEIRVTVPEPQMVVNPTALGLGMVKQGKSGAARLVVGNQRGSPCEVTVAADVSWVKAVPDRFRCAVGSSVDVTIEADTGHARLGTHRVTLSVRSTVGSWQSQTAVVVMLEVLDPEYEEKQALARLEKAIQTDDDELIIAAWAPILENYPPAQHHRPRKEKAEKRLVALRRFEKAVTTDDDELIIKDYDASLLDRYHKVKESDLQRLELARKRIEALGRIRDALSTTNDERLIVGAYDKILDGYPKLRQDEREKIERALRCVAMPELIRKAIRLEDDVRLVEVYDPSLLRPWMDLKPEEIRRITLAQQRQTALQAFREALKTDDDELIVAIYQPILDGYALVTPKERLRLAQARQRLAQLQRRM